MKSTSSSHAARFRGPSSELLVAAILVLVHARCLHGLLDTSYAMLVVVVDSDIVVVVYVCKGVFRKKLYCQAVRLVVYICTAASSPSLLTQHALKA